MIVTRTSLSRLDAGVLLALALFFAAGLVPGVHAQTPSDPQAQIGQAFVAVQQAEQSGGNVTALVAQLNSAVSLLQQADQINSTNPSKAQSLYAQASALARQVITGAPAIAAAGRASAATARLELGVETVVLAALAVVAYLYSPRIFWRLWVRAHRDWRVKKR